MNELKNRDLPDGKRKDQTMISVVLPVYNEAEILGRLCHALQQQLDTVQCQYEILFINDGSTDGSDRKLDQLAGENSRIKVLHFSRNFGHQAAVHAGLCHATGDAVIVMDSDMQDEPGSLPEFIRHWQMGFDVVYAVRTNRKENFVKRGLFRLFYRTLNAVSCTRIPNDAGVFSLMDRAVVQNVVRMAEHDRYLPGLRQWVGFRQIGLPVERNARHDETPRVSFYQLFQLAKTALFSFSRVPLSSFYAIASVSVLVCAGCIGFTLYHKFFTGLAIPGWASMTIIGSFFGALNALGIGVLGEYVVRIYDQVRNRPQFIIQRTCNIQREEDSLGSEQDILESVRDLLEQTAQTSNPSEQPRMGLPIESDSKMLTPGGGFPTLSQ